MYRRKYEYFMISQAPEHHTLGKNPASLRCSRCNSHSTTNLVESQGDCSSERRCCAPNSQQIARLVVRDWKSRTSYGDAEVPGILLKSILYASGLLHHNAFRFCADDWEAEGGATERRLRD